MRLLERPRDYFFRIKRKPRAKAQLAIVRNEMAAEKKKFNFEIDVSDRTCDHYSRWANYGTIVCEGDNFDELLESACVDIMDQDGGELNVVPADSKWMMDLIGERLLEALKDQAETKAWNQSNMVYPDENEPIDPRQY